MTLTTEVVAVAVAAMSVAGLLKGIVGIGMPAIAIGLMGLAIAPMEAAALIVLPTLASNVWQALAGPDVRGLLRRLWPFLVTTALATFVCGALVGSGAGAGRIWLGLVLAVYALLGLTRPQPQVPASVEQAVGVASGLATGTINAMTGTAVFPAVLFLQALGLGKDALVQGAGMLALVSSFSLGVVLGAKGMFGTHQAMLSLALLVPALGGVWVGQHVRHVLSEQTFRAVFLVCLGLLGSYLVWHGLR